MDLSEIRREIDQVDAELVALLEKRMNLVSQVVAYKRSTGKAIKDSGREEKIFEQVAAHVENEDYTDTIVRTFSDILRQSRHYQEKRLS